MTKDIIVLTAISGELDIGAHAFLVFHPEQDEKTISTV